MRARSRLHHPCIRLPLARRGLLGTTALQAAFALGFALPAAAQPAPGALPQGGVVVAGQASIASTPGATTITQGTDRAAINWQSFDVGAQGRVVFQQPSSGSVTLNRVVTPRPSEIAGRIEANGSVVLINSAGVVFHRGAQVEAQSFVASTADTTNAAFMAGGRLRLDRPGQPGARIENRGNITVREAGLAALVAPGVANSGTIRARMGTVVLAGAETHTIDLHGDGLVAFDVTGQVRTAPLGPDGRPTAALVTNSGTIVAEGGTVLLTAQAADGLVQNLVSAGGTIRADTLGARAGHVEIAGLGGSIRVDGTLAAAGRRAGEGGGTIVAHATEEVRLGETARVVASGRAGGGTVAIGTTAARARAQGGGVGPENARRATVAAGARIAADATDGGAGGTVAVIGRARVDHAGAITARGGAQGGDGGRVEISSNGVFGLTGLVDTSAPAGSAGTLLIDPVNLKIVATLPGGAIEQKINPTPPPHIGAGDPAAGGGDDAFILKATVQNLLSTTNVRLEASNDIFVNAKITSNKGNTLTLAAGNSITVNQPISVDGGIALFASSPALKGVTPTAGGTVAVNADLTATTGSIALVAFGASGQVKIGADVAVTAGRVLTLAANAMQLPTGAVAGSGLSAPTVEITSAGGAMTLGGAAAPGVLNLVSVTPAAGQTTNLKAISGAGLLRLGGSELTFEGVTPLASGVTLAGDLALTNVDLDLRAAGQVARSGGTLSGVKVLTGQAGTGFLMDGVGHQFASLGAIETAAGRVSIRMDGDQTLGALQIKAPDGFHFQAEGKLTIAAPILRKAEVALTGRTIRVNDGAAIESLDAAVVLTTTAVAPEPTPFLFLESAVRGATRVTIRSDAFDRNGQAIVTKAGGVVELATNSAIPFPIGDFSGYDTTTLRIGAATAPFATAPTVTAASIQIQGDPGAAAGFQVLDLRATGAVTQGVPITLKGRVLTGAAGSFALTEAANAIPELGGVAAATGSLKIATAGALLVSGKLEAPVGGIALKAGAGGIALEAEVAAGTTLELATPGAVGGAGRVAAGTLAGSVGALDLGGTVPAAIARIGDLSAAAGVRILGSGTMEVVGTLAAGTGPGGGAAPGGDVELSAATLRVGGSIVAGTAGGAHGSIALAGADAVQIDGDLRAHRNAGLGGGIALASAAGGIAQSAGLVHADAGLALTSAGAIAQGGGTMRAESLTAKVAGAIALTGANLFATLGSVTAGRDIALVNAQSLLVTEPVRGGLAAGGPVEVAISAAGTLTVAGEIAAGGGAVAGSIALKAQDGASAGRLVVKSGATLLATRAGGAGGVIGLRADSATAGQGVVQVDAALAAPAGGGFAVEGNGVVIAGSLTAPQGRIALRTDALNFLGLGNKLVAEDGTVAVTPRAPNASIGLGGGVADLVLDAALFTRIALGTTGVLEIGAADAGPITLAASTAIPQAPTLRLLTGAGIGAAPGAVLTVARLEGEAAGAIALGGTAHQVQRLGPLKAGTTLGFKAAGALDLDGPVRAGTAGLEIEAGSTLRVLAGGSIGAGAGQVVTLIADAMDFAGAVAAPGGRIEILPRTAGLGMTLAGAGGLALSQASLGQLQADTLRLGARQGGPAVAGNLTVAGLADLTGRVDRLSFRVIGGVGSSGLGSGIVVNRLGDAAPAAGQNATGVSLTDAANRIGALDALAVNGDLTIRGSRALTVAGPVEAAGRVVLDIASADPVALAVTGSLAGGTLGGAPSGVAGDVLLLTGAGALDIAAGAQLRARGGMLEMISAGALGIAAGATASADGAATLSGTGGVAIGGAVAAGAGIAVTASGGAPALDLAAAGSLRATAGDVVLNIAGAANLAGTLTADAGDLVLAGGAIAGTGPVTANALNGSATSVALTGAGNSLPVLGPFTATGGLALTTTGALTLAGTVTAGGAVTLNAASLLLPIGTVLDAAGQTVTLVTAGGIAGGGTLRAGALNADAGAGAIDLPGLGNAIAGLGTLDAGSFITLASTLPLTVTGLVEAPDGVSLTSGAAGAGALTVAAGGTVRATAPGGDVTLAASAGDLAIAGTVTAPDRVRLEAGGGIAQTGGTIEGGVVELAALGAVTQGGGRIAATVTDLAITGASLALGGTLEAARDAVLTATGGDAALAGTLAAGRDATLAAQAGSLAIGGTVEAGRVATLVAGLGLPAPGSPVANRDIAVTGSVTAGTTLNVSALGAANATGALKAATLTGRTGGVAAFAGANAIGTLGSFAAGATLRLDNTQALTVAGPASATGMIALDIAGALKLAAGAGPFTLDAPGLSLGATAITQPGGAIRTGALAAKATGGITLDQAANQIAALGDVGAGAALKVATATGLGLGGTIGGTDVTLAAVGDIAQTAGSLAWTGTATLTAGGAITQAGGALAGGPAALLTGSAGGAVALTGAGNAVPRLGAFTAGSGFALRTGGDLLVTGAVAAGAGALALEAGGALGLQAVALGGAAGSFAAGDAFTQQAGGSLGFGAGALDITAGGRATLAGSGTAGTATINAATFDLPATGSLALSGALNLATTGAAALDGTITAGSANLNVGSLSQAAGGTITLPGAFAVVATGAVGLDGAVTAGGGVQILAGSVAQGAGGSLSGNISVGATGAIELDGQLTAAGANVLLSGATLRLGAGSGVNVSGLFDVTTTGAAVLDGAVFAGSAALNAGSIAQGAGGQLVSSSSLEMRVTGDLQLDGRIEAVDTTLSAVGLRQGASGRMALRDLALAATGDVAIAGRLDAASAAVTAGGFTLAGGARLAVAGNLQLDAANTARFEGDAGAATARLTAGELRLVAGARLDAAGDLRIAAASDAVLDGVIRGAAAGDLSAGRDLRQAAAGDMQFAGLLRLEAGRDMVLDGRVIADESLVIAGRDLAQGAGGLLNASGLRDLRAGRDITLAGVLIGDPVRIAAGGDVIQAAGASMAASTTILAVSGDAAFLGALATGLVTGTVGGVLTLDGPAMRPARLADLAAGQGMVVEAAGPLALGGVLAAPSMIIRALGPVEIGDLGLRIGGVPFVQAPPGSLTLARLPEPIPGTPGAVIETRANRLDINRLTVDPLSGFNNTTLALRLPPNGGNMDLGTIVGRTTDLTLDLGIGGRAVGNIDLGNLTVLGGGGGSNLQGTIGGLGGQAAAGRAGLGPRLQPEYQINNCPLASVNCVQLVLRLTTPANPLREIGLTGARDEREDPDIFVPNAAERDF